MIVHCQQLLSGYTARNAQTVSNRCFFFYIENCLNHCSEIKTIWKVNKNSAIFSSTQYAFNLFTPKNKQKQKKQW